MGTNPHYLAQEEDHKILDENVFYIENEYIKFGINTALGGTVTYLAEHGKNNLINSADWGRQVQMSFYAPPAPYQPEGVEMAECWKFIGWNPFSREIVTETAPACLNTNVKTMKYTSSASLCIGH